MPELDSGYVDRRDVLFERARDLIRSDIPGFTVAGYKLAELFPAKRVIEVRLPDDPEDGIERFSLFRRVADAARVAAYPETGNPSQSSWFAFNNIRDGEEKQLSARMTILAILLGADDKAAEAITPAVCELGALPYETDCDTELGRIGVDWTERDWSHGNDPSPKVIERLERVVSYLLSGRTTHNRAPSRDNSPVDYDCTKPGRNRVDEARRATHNLCRLAESFGGIAQRRADAQYDCVSERDRLLVELRDYARVVYGQWEPALVRVRRAIQAIRPAAAGWGIELGPVEDAINRLQVAIDRPVALNHGEQPGDHLFRPMNALGLGHHSDPGPRLNFDRLADAIGVVGSLSNALRGIDEAGLDNEEAHLAGMLPAAKPPASEGSSKSASSSPNPEADHQPSKDQANASDKKLPLHLAKAGASLAWVERVQPDLIDRHRLVEDLRKAQYDYIQDSGECPAYPDGPPEPESWETYVRKFLKATRGPVRGVKPPSSASVVRAADLPRRDAGR